MRLKCPVAIAESLATVSAMRECIAFDRGFVCSPILTFLPAVFFTSVGARCGAVRKSFPPEYQPPCRGTLIHYTSFTTFEVWHNYVPHKYV